VYTFTVKAINTAMIASAPSNSVAYKTARRSPACNRNPTSPITDLTASTSASKNPAVVTLKWTPPAIGTKGGDLGGSSCSIAGYQISSSRNGTVVKAKSSGSYVENAVPACEYRYDVTPFNQYGSGPTTSVFITVLANE
jgi:hypothetical protein